MVQTDYQTKLLPEVEDLTQENESQRDDLDPNRTESWPGPLASPYGEQNKLLKYSVSRSHRSTNDI